MTTKEHDAWAEHEVALAKLTAEVDELDEDISDLRQDIYHQRELRDAKQAEVDKLVADYEAKSLHQRSRLDVLREHMATMPDVHEYDADPDVNVARFDAGCEFDDWAEDQLAKSRKGSP